MHCTVLPCSTRCDMMFLCGQQQDVNEGCETDCLLWWKVTELPNSHFANGYEHHGNLRLIVSSPPRDPCFPGSLICCGDCSRCLLHPVVEVPCRNAMPWCCDAWKPILHTHLSFGLERCVICHALSTECRSV